mmetsp:Transcript_14042/g.34260  ORF Transcript_14042/g.34260 Transcript_14042/m.34260 type:complete len:656 (+) Transcript_14042:89-2056(+)|eukprot:CAMPEP_0114505390 /NCGR_PEP_ID=MMETSP0109-20121206/10829_1 /TAXON_ID=29199 /ORGANISM="Chlorarachnion reptans, Strain CCCM449" /LENGTH=655 /DNA_ID=CAMNT_0001683829 /DNA_START=84 /DNA_END=2051 /DNA_ORIENTATION=+
MNCGRFRKVCNILLGVCNILLAPYHRLQRMFKSLGCGPLCSLLLIPVAVACIIQGLLYFQKNLKDTVTNLIEVQVCDVPCDLFPPHFNDGKSLPKYYNSTVTTIFGVDPLDIADALTQHHIFDRPLRNNKYHFNLESGDKYPIFKPRNFTISGCEPVCDKIPFPGGVSELQKTLELLDNDAIFGGMRFYGPNAMIIERKNPFHSKNEKLEAAIQHQAEKLQLDPNNYNYHTLKRGNNFFVANYSILEKAKIPSRDGSFYPIPIAVFALFEDTLMPLVINVTSPMEETKTMSGSFYPQDKNTNTWRFAKLCVNTADMQTHELGYHVTYTHFLVEMYVHAASNLPDDHIIKIMLTDLSRKTPELGRLARDFLIPAAITAMGLPLVFQASVVNLFWNEYNVTEQFFPNELRKRGFKVSHSSSGELVCDAPTRYYFAKYGIKGHEIFKTLVSSTLHQIYKNKITDVDKQVTDDQHVQEWVSNIQSKVESGKKWAFKGGFPSLCGAGAFERLVDIMTQIYFAATFYHSQVNYKQEQYFSFVPYVSLHLNSFSGNINTIQAGDLLKIINHQELRVTNQEQIIRILTDWSVDPYPLTTKLGVFVNGTFNSSPHLTAYMNGTEDAKKGFKTLGEEIYKHSKNSTSWDKLYVLHPAFTPTSIEH